MAVTRINNNQITAAVSGNAYLGINAASRLQNYSITSNKLANSLVYGSDLTVSGNLTVNGTTTTVDTINTLIQDPLLVLADGQTAGTPTVDIGIIGYRGSSLNSFIGWKESANTFVAALTNTAVSNTTANLTAYADFGANNVVAYGNLSVVGNVVGNISFSGNISAGNLLTSGLVSATGNVTGGNVTTGGQVSASGDITGNNLYGQGVVSTVGNVTGGNILTVGLISSTGNLTSGNINTAGLITATGNITGGNLLYGSGIVSGTGNIYAANFIGNISGNIDAAGNITEIQFNTTGDILGANANFTYNQTTNLLTVNGGNINTGNLSATGQVVATSNITGGNILTAGIVSSTGNAIAGNVLTAGLVSATGNVITAGALNGATLSLSGNVTSPLNVTGNTTSGNLLTPGIVSATGNATVGNLNTAGLITATGNITGGNVISLELVQGVTVSASGNVIAGNVSTTGLVTATGNVTGGNLLTAGIVSATGNAIVGNVNTAGLVTATGNITGGNLLTAGLVSATGNATAGNVNTAGLITATGNITGGNILTAGLISVAGNITSATNVNTPNVVATGNLELVGGNILISPASGNIVVNNTYINGIAQPVQDNDAASKIYVDNLVSTQIAYHPPVYVATTTTLASATGGTITYNNGANGVGATITTTGSFNLIDTANVQTANTRILVKDEGNAALNGVYQWSNATVITRAPDADTYGPNSANDLSINDYFFVQNGNVNKGSAYVVNAPAGVITFGTSNITFAQFSSSQTYTAGNGISLYGTVISTVYDNNTIGVNGSNQLYVPPNATFTTPNIGAATGISLSVTGGITAGTTLSSVGNTIAGNVLTAGLVSATGNVTGGNILTGGLVSATGNATAGNILTSGLISATSTITSASNITGGNILTSGLFSSAGNIYTSANINQTGTGNINGYNGYFSNSLSVLANLYTTGNVVAVNSGIFYGNSVTGNGAIYAGLPTYTALGSNVVAQFSGNANSYSQINFQNISNGTSASTDYIATADNGTDTSYYVDLGINSSTFNDPVDYPGFGPNDAYVHNHGGNLILNPETTGKAINFMVGGTANANVIGYVNASGLFISGIESVSGNITGGNLLTGGLISATSNITGGNILTSGIVSSTGNATVGNLLTAGLVSATSNITGGNLLTAGIVSATGNAIVGNLTTVGLVTATGNITGGNLITDGLITATGNIIGGNILYGSGMVSGTGNIYGGNLFVTSIESVTGNITGGNLLTDGLVSATGNVTGGNILTSGLVSATGNGTFGNIVLTGDFINQLQANSIITVNGANANTNFEVNGTANSVFYINAANNTAAFGNTQTYANAIVAFNAPTSIVLPASSTANRPSNASSVTGMIRFNTTDNALEIYNNTQWTQIGGTTFTVIADEQFNGDGSTVQFTLGSSQTTNSCIVSINGIVQIPGTAYSVSGTFPTCYLTFTEAPAISDLIDVREITTTTTVTALANPSGNAEIRGNSTAAELDITGNLIPVGANASQTLGDATHYWKSLYVGGNTIYLGGLQLQSTTGNVFSVTTDGSTPASFGPITVGSGNITVGNILNGNGNGVGNIGNSTNYFNTVFAKATSAQYADLAEKYEADAEYAPGTVLSFGGEKEVTKSSKDGDRAVAGVVSTNPSYVMNATLEAEHVAVIAFTGRVPTSVTGTVAKGDLMVSNGDGTARAEADPKAGAIIGKALENFAGSTGVIEVVIGRF